MVFASFIFLFWFLPTFLVGYFALPRRLRNLWLTLASFVFYGWWRPPYVLLMVGSTVIDWWCARAMGPIDSSRRRRVWLWVSVTTNLSLLGFFKYSNLVVESWNALGVWPLPWEQVLLPIGISFYTFQSMSYTIDVYRGEVQPSRSFADLLCFVTMFPQLVAGPIVRYRDVQAQIVRRVVSWSSGSDGVFLFAIGFTKKVLIADRVAPLVDAAFALPAPGMLAAWTGVLAFAVQIYFDFSGYSDMAIGLGKMIGFEFPNNFASPYRATSITDFWRRWHISLSTWLRDYLYVPLGGNRHGSGRTCFNLAVTMLLGGLWHGAHWTFLLWGAWQGAWLILERRLGKVAPYGFLPHWMQIACTFVLVLGGWAIFRAGSVAELLRIWSSMAGMHGFGAAVTLPFLTGQAYTVGILGLLIAFLLPRSEQVVERFHPAVILGAMAGFGLAVCHLLATSFSPFLYLPVLIMSNDLGAVRMAGTAMQRIVRAAGVASFLLVLFAVPVGQVLWSAFAGEARERYRTFGYVPAPPAQVGPALDGSYMVQLERHLEEASPVVWAVRGSYNEWRFRLGLLQSDKVHIGNGGWMFYRQGMSPDAAVVDGMHERRIAAFAAVKAALARLGAELYVVVLPDKDRLYPEFAYADGMIPPLKARLYPMLMQELEAAGVAHLDALQALSRAKSDSPAQLLYCQRDSHWTPLGARTVAAALAENLLHGALASSLGAEQPGLVLSLFEEVALLPDLVGLCGMRYVMRPMPSLAARFPFPASSLTETLVEQKRYYRVALTEERGTGEPDSSEEQLRRQSTIALAATSFSGDNGAAFYSFELHRLFLEEVIVAGAGSVAPMQTVMAHMLAHPGQIRLVVWEVVERGVLEGEWTGR